MPIYQDHHQNEEVYVFIQVKQSSLKQYAFMMKAFQKKLQTGVTVISTDLIKNAGWKPAFFMLKAKKFTDHQR